jgi:hypothetical protein
MIATDEPTRVNIRTGEMANAATRTGDTRMGDRLFDTSLGSLAFQAGHLGAGLGWHGSIANGPAMSGERYVLEICS